MNSIDKKKFKILEENYKTQTVNEIFKQNIKIKKENVASKVALTLLISNLLYYFYKKYRKNKNLEFRSDMTNDEPGEPFDPWEPFEPNEPDEPGEPGEPGEPSDITNNNFFKKLSSEKEKAKLMEFLKDLEETVN